MICIDTYPNNSISRGKAGPHVVSGPTERENVGNLSVSDREPDVQDAEITGIFRTKI